MKIYIVIVAGSDNFEVMPQAYLSIDQAETYRQQLFKAFNEGNAPLIGIQELTIHESNQRKLNKFEEFACGRIFHSYPEDKTFEEIIALCLDDDARESFNDALEETDNEDQQLTLCEEYEAHWWETIPHLLNDLKESAEHQFGDKK